jgi:hypothetical protein
VRIEDDRTVHVAQHPAGIAQFERAAVDLSGIDDWRDLLHAAAAALRALRASVAAEHLIVRLALAGATPLAWRLRRDADQVQAELNAIAAELPGCWIDSVETALVSLPALAEQPGADGSAVAELQRLIGSDILPAASYQRALAEIADELRGQLPPECRHLLGTDAEQARRALAALARDGVQDVLARLQAVPDREAP